MPTRVNHPAKRIYRSKPNTHQRRFPIVSKTVRYSPQPLTSKVNSKQNTLTQLDFVFHIDEDDGDTFEEQGRSDEEAEEQDQPKKKRRRIGIGPSQQTLTQIQFFDQATGEDEEVEENSTDANSTEEYASADDFDTAIPNSTPDAGNADYENNQAFEKENIDPYSSQGNILKQKGLMHYNKENGGESSENAQVTHPRVHHRNGIISTPPKPIKREIPSSQSPASASLTPSPRSSPDKSPRSPLREIAICHTPSRDTTISPFHSRIFAASNLRDQQSFSHTSPKAKIQSSPSRFQNSLHSEATTPDQSQLVHQHSQASYVNARSPLLPCFTTALPHKQGYSHDAQEEDTFSPTSPCLDLSSPLSFVTPSSQPHIGSGGGRKRRLRSLTPMSPLGNTADVVTTSQLLGEESDCSI